MLREGVGAGSWVDREVVLEGGPKGGQGGGGRCRRRGGEVGDGSFRQRQGRCKGPVVAKVSVGEGQCEGR